MPSLNARRLFNGSRPVVRVTAGVSGRAVVVWPTRFDPVVVSRLRAGNQTWMIPEGATHALVIASGGGAGGGESGSQDGQAGEAGRLIAKKVTLPSNAKKLKVNVGRGGSVAGYEQMTENAKGEETVVDVLDVFGYELPTVRVSASGGANFASYDTRDGRRDLLATTLRVMYRKMLIPSEWNFLLDNRTVRDSLYVETRGGGSRELWQGPDPRTRVSLDGKYGSGGYGGTWSSLMGGLGGDGFVVVGFIKE